MHDIEPFYRWRANYAVEDDKQSSFFKTTYSEPKYVYNYILHPLWDEFGSTTLYLKVLYANYDKGFTIIEFIGEWNDTLYNDIEALKRRVIEPMIDKGISKFILILENVLNFHGSDDCYYEEWAEECQDSFNGGWIVALNTFPHVVDEMHTTHLDTYVHFGAHYNDVNWRQHTPKSLFSAVEMLVNDGVRRLH